MRNVVNRFIEGIVLLVLTAACSEPPVPKPKAMLRLEYSGQEYAMTDLPCPFQFEKNTKASLQSDADCSFVMQYPEMNANIFFTYKEVDGDLDKLLRDAQKLTYEHVVKADNITEQPFINEKDRVYGMFYNVEGNAASQTQFYLTDSINHFVTGSLYFEAKPNYDSILPAAHYLGKDIRTIMETLSWN